MEQASHVPELKPTGNRLLALTKKVFRIATPPRVSTSSSSSIASLEQGLTPDVVVERLESQGFAREAPRFTDQANDKTRDAAFRSTRSPSTRMTEYEGLNELARALLPKVRKGDRLAKAFYEHLTFVGAREYDQSVKGLAAYWKSYLDADPANKLCIGALITGSEYTRNPNAIKSDVYVLDRILRQLFPTDEDYKKYSDRFFINDLSKIDLDDEAHYKMIFVDDQMLSGNQMGWSMGRMIADDKWPKLKEHMDRVEINLLVASHNQLQNGLRLPGLSESGEDETIKIKGFIRANKDTSGVGLPGDPDGESVRTRKGYKQLRSRPDADAFIANIYSSGDYDYEYVLEKIFQDGRYGLVPHIANIVSPYSHDRGLVSRWAQICQLQKQM